MTSADRTLPGAAARTAPEAGAPAAGLLASVKADVKAVAGLAAGSNGGERLPVFDSARVEAAVRELLAGMGEDPDREGLRETPARVARAFEDMTAGLRSAPAATLTTVFDEHHDELVLIRDITLASLCEHHLLPFVGKAHVGYIPNEQGEVTGLSKLARLVDLCSRRPQVQERLTTQIADALEESLHPRGVIVVLEAEHMCMSVRGVRKPGAVTVTSAVRGQFRRSAPTRAEAISLMRLGQ